MGGDYAPREIIKGTVFVAQEHSDVQFILVGPPRVVRDELASSLPSKNISIETASDVIEMGEQAAWSIRSKSNSSIVVGARLVKEERANAFVSAGNTGAVVSAALLTYGRIKGISRPAIAVVVPTPVRPVVLLDVGATADCKAENLLEFARMGCVYAAKILSVVNPSVGLLSIGEEKSKGNELVRVAHGLLEKSGLNFVGNVEGKDISLGKTDVVICDGFTGNVVLKLMESLAGVIFSEVKQVISGSVGSRLGGLLLAPGLRELKRKLDYEEYGGAQLLGVDGVCIIAHGGSKARAIKNAIKLAIQTVSKGVVKEIGDSLVAEE